MMTHLSLFSGIGGLDIAAEWAGFTTVGQCEFADYQTKVLAKHWPDVPRWRDIRTLTGDSFYERTGLRTVDIISGGFPCQPFSTAGKRRGAADDRFLWPEMLRVVQELRPTFVIGENVAGLASMAKPGGVARVESRSIARLPDADHYEAVYVRQEEMQLYNILQDLEKIGYEVQPFIVPACAVDAPHRRDRIAIVAYCDHGQRQAPPGPVRPGRAAVGSSCEYVPDPDSVRRDRRRADRQGIQRDTPRHEADTGGPDDAIPRRMGGQPPDYDLADTHGGRRLHGQDEKCPAKGRGEAQPDLGKCGENVADAAGEQLEGTGPKETRSRLRHPARRRESLSDTDGPLPVRRDQELPAPENPGGGGPDHRGRTPVNGCWEWWPAEPSVGRVAYGVPDRVDRLRCLGNAVVPQQFFPFFYAAAEIIQKGRDANEHHSK